MKEHIYSQMISELRDIAIMFHGTQQLRERIDYTVQKHFKLDEEWNNNKKLIPRSTTK